jgi:hypothetical protein
MKCRFENQLPDVLCKTLMINKRGESKDVEVRPYRKSSPLFDKVLTWKGQDPMYSDEHVFSITTSVITKWMYRFQEFESPTLNSPSLIPPFLQTFERSSSVFLSQFILLFFTVGLPLKMRLCWAGQILCVELMCNELCTTRKANFGITFDVRFETRAFLCPTYFSGFGTSASFPSS